MPQAIGAWAANAAISVLGSYAYTAAGTAAWLTVQYAATAGAYYALAEAGDEAETARQLLAEHLRIPKLRRSDIAMRPHLKPIRLVGTCLNPHIEDGAFALLDEGVAPKSGDLVAVRWNESTYEALKLAHGADIPRDAVKLLWSIDDRWALINNAGWLWLQDSEITGVVRHVDRNDAELRQRLGVSDELASEIRRAAGLV